jgi:hypothetical protein
MHEGVEKEQMNAETTPNALCYTNFYMYSLLWLF